MRLILDVDYQDLCLSGHGDRASLRSLFEKAKLGGISTMLFAPMVCGKAIYPSRVAATMSKPVRTHPGSPNIAELMSQFDVISEVARLSREFGLELMLYFRLVDDFFPGLEEININAHPEWWWQSRCGDFPLRGWPCYHYPEVREYKLRLLKEHLSYGFDSVLFDVGRSHSFYASPHREPDFFGFNSPIVDAMRSSTGKDISSFDHLEYLVLDKDLFAKIPYIYSAKYVGAVEFDREAWHWEKGRGFEMFLREARKLAGEQTEVLLQGAYVPPHPVAIEGIAPASFYLDSSKLAAGNVIDGVLNSSNWSTHTLTPDMHSFMFPFYDGVRQAGKSVGTWLNDMFTPNGGDTLLYKPTDNIQKYWDQFVAKSGMDFVVIHEADFIVRHPQEHEVWRLLRSFAS
jgi:hypothetical protein